MTRKQGEVTILKPHFRQATEADADDLARLRWDFSPDEVAASSQSFEEFRAAFREFWVSALASGNWAVWLLVERDALHNRYGYVTNLYTEPDLRGRGIGEAVTDLRTAGVDHRLVYPDEHGAALAANQLLDQLVFD